MRLTVEQIIHEVSKYYDLDPAFVVSKCRKMEYIKAKHIAIYFSRKYLNYPYDFIGSFFRGNYQGRLDHATIMHAIKSVNDQMTTNRAYAFEIYELSAQIDNMFNLVMEEFYQENDFVR